MSELPGPEHDPDPAALDELQRAFADDEPDRAPDDEPDRAPDDEPDDERDRDPDRALDDEPAQATAADDYIDRRGDDRGEAGAADAHRTAVATNELPTTHPSASDADVAAEHLQTTELPEVPGDAGPDTATPADRTSAPEPTIVRIDDYAGTPASTPDGPAATDPDAAPETAGPVDPLIATGPSAASDGPAGTSDASEPPATAVIGDAGASVEVISISDDDLPDPVYVEGSLDADGSGSIVVIEDDDTGDALGAESQRDLRRGIEPRMRERRLAVKRAQNKRRLVKLAIVAGGVLIVVAVLAVLGSPMFAVRADDVEVSGAVYTDEDRLDEIIDDAVGTPVLRLDTGELEAELEAIPWVETATVRTDFPHGLIIDIRERAAVTTYRGPDGRFRVLDRDGRVLDVLEMYPFAYVLLGGPDPVDLDEGEFAPQGYVSASELATNLTSSMRGQVEQIEVTADGSRMVAHLSDGSTVFFGEARDLLAKLVRLEAVLTNGQECEPGLIDVSTADVTRCE